MKHKQKIGVIAVFAVSVLLLWWVNTGSHAEAGYQDCGRNGVTPQSDLLTGPSLYNGPCLGLPTIVSAHGHYDSGITLIANTALYVVAGASIVAFVYILRVPSPKQKKRKDSKKPVVS